jgi:hypothetical protein
MEESSNDVEETASLIELTEVRPPLSEIEIKQIDLMLARYAKRYPNSDFDQMSVRERWLLIGFAEFYGFARMQWVLKDLWYRPGVPTTESVTVELDAHLKRERKARDPLELEREDKLVDCICCALLEGKFRNMDEFFKGREDLDNHAIRHRVWGILLL